jgi:diadenosine tetraphosphate (Ap4A) HIT family hydrolase
VRRLVRKNREQLLTDLYEERLEERDRLVRILAEQVEYLRAQLNAPTHTVGMAIAPRTPVAEDVSIDIIPAFGGDDRDELEAMQQAGVISDEEYQQALALLTAGENIIE